MGRRPSAGGLPQTPLGRFPNNYLLRAAETYFQRVRGDRPAARLAAQHSCACSMRNPEAWNQLENIINEQGHEIRQGRYVQDLSPEELRVCRAIYEELLKASKVSGLLDPKFGVGWRHVLNAAAFLGDRKQAEEALWKGIELRPDLEFGLQFGPDPEDFRIFWWGLELFQEKWFNDPAKLERVANDVIERSERWLPGERVEAAISLFHAGRLDLARKVVRGDDEVEDLDAHIKLHKDQEAKG